MTEKYIYEESIWDVLALPDDWKECISYLDDGSARLHLFYSDLLDDPSFLNIAIDQMSDFNFSYPPLGCYRNPQLLSNELEAFMLMNSKHYTLNKLYRYNRYIPFRYWYDRPDFVAELVKNNYDSYRDAPKKLLKDKSYALNAASINGAILEFSPRVIRNDLDIATAALESNPFAIHFLTKTMQSRMDATLIDHCLRISEGDKKELHKIKNKKVISNIFVCLMHCGPSVYQSKLNKGSYRYKPYKSKRWNLSFLQRMDPFGIDDDFLLYAFSINPELISYFRLSQLDDLGRHLIKLSSSNPFLHTKEIQNAQKILFDAYIDKTKDLDFVNTPQIINHAKRMCNYV